MTNFTAGHETRTKLTGAEKFDYPDRHIEADNRLSWHLGRLDQAFGDDAYYVHLFRDPTAVARSYAQRWHQYGGIAAPYRDGILQVSPATRIEAMEDYVATVEANIRLFLRDKTKVLSMDIADVRDDFPVFWNAIGAEGNLDAAMKEWDVPHNETRPSSPMREFRKRRAGLMRLLFPPR